MAQKPQNLIETISQSLEDLRRSDRKVANTILNDPARVIEMKLIDLANLSEVSEPTVIRFCNAIGCDGFQDMKIKLARSLAFGASSAHMAIKPTDPLPTVVTKIFEFNLSSLDWVRSKLDLDAMTEAARLLGSAQTIHFFGLGASSIVAQDAQQKFPLFGCPCNAVVDVHQQLIAASMLRKGDVLVSISYSGTSREIVQATRLAREQGATTISISGGDGPLSRYCDCNIKIESLENTDIYTPTISRIASIAIIDILSTHIALSRSDEERARVAEMKRRLADVRSTGIV